MSRLDDCFAALDAANKKALIPFVTAGDPNADFTLTCMHEMVQAGANIIELGVPFSDPMSDGPVIQKASERALAAGMSLKGVIALVKQFRKTDQKTPLILMGYLNPIEFMGYERFAEKASQAGVDGVLTVDIPPEESADLIAAYEKHALAPIFLLSPTSNETRIKKIAAVAKGYIYYVSLKGVTGAGHLELGDVEQKVRQIKQHTALPIAVGFGVKNSDIAANIAKISDAVVVGSALINCITDHAGNEQHGREAIDDLLVGMRTAMDAVPRD
ncbi:MAG: tryptophan synthase subunit alpha [Cycloclasticus sp. symbiont of Poecilosclerida sp. N]|nr:MAG: tryptophan synthase subunit alpha [Cycloclasticus sp. symbiont of Poecilosclerida sp. N]